MLVHDELCACQITELLQVAGATASRHLSLMVNAGVLKNRRQGRWIYFRLNREDQSLLPLYEWAREQLSDSSQVDQDLKAIKNILLIPCEELSHKQRESGTCSESQK